VWLLVGDGVVTILLAILGAYLTIWGPAAGA
jgi:hypothetical protein